MADKKQFERQVSRRCGQVVFYEYRRIRKASTMSETGCVYRWRTRRDCERIRGGKVSVNDGLGDVILIVAGLSERRLVAQINGRRCRMPKAYSLSRPEVQGFTMMRSCSLLSCHKSLRLPLSRLHSFNRIPRYAERTSRDWLH